MGGKREGQGYRRGQKDTSTLLEMVGFEKLREVGEGYMEKIEKSQNEEEDEEDGKLD